MAGSVEKCGYGKKKVKKESFVQIQHNRQITSDIYQTNEGSYRTDKVIGSGAFATVFRTNQQSSTQTVAIKAFRDCSLALQEASVLRLLQGCTNVISLIYVGDNFLILQCIDGGDLYSTIKRDGPLSFQHSFNVLAQVTSALDEIHDRGYAHLDVKPENVLIQNTSIDMQVLLCDFGCAHRTSSSLRGLIGTRQFAAPEILNGSRYHPAPCDLWSLGCLFFVMLNATPPFEEAASTCHYFNRIKQKDYSGFFSHHNLHSGVEIPRAARATLERLLKANPKKRPAVRLLKDDFFLQKQVLKPVQVGVRENCASALTRPVLANVNLNVDSSSEHSRLSF